MADFVQFGAGTAEAAKLIAGNCDRAGVAAFLVFQQDAIQKRRIDDRLAGNDKKAGSAGGGNAQVSDPAVTGEASGAWLRIKAMLGQQ